METEHAHSCVTETGFENQSVSTTNLVGGYMKEQSRISAEVSLPPLMIIFFSP